jgi:hypothetical protein
MRMLLRSMLGAFVLMLAWTSVALADAPTTNSGDNLRDGWYPNALSHPRW